jgi:hypothetical protein
MISGIQAIVVLFGIGLLYLSYVYYRRKDFSLPDLSLWAVITLGGIIPIIFPERFEFLLTPLTVYSVFDLLTVSGLVVLFAITFRMYKVTRHNERKVDEVVRSLAMGGGAGKAAKKGVSSRR